MKSFLANLAFIIKKLSKKPKIVKNRGMFLNIGLINSESTKLPLFRLQKMESLNVGEPSPENKSLLKKPKKILPKHKQNKGKSNLKSPSWPSCA